jgi:hypothetical protein
MRAYVLMELDLTEIRLPAPNEVRIARGHNTIVDERRFLLYNLRRLHMEMCHEDWFFPA